YRLPGPHFFLYPFEDDDVGVGRDSDRQDQSGETRQGQRDVEEEDRGIEEGRVDAEPDHRDQPEEAVQDEEEDGHEQQTDQGRLLRLVEGVLAERGRDIGALYLLEVVLKRPRLE